MASLIICKVMSFIEDHKIRSNLLSLAERVEQLVSVNLGRPDNERCVRVLFPVPG